MAQQIIDTGAAVNVGGDSLRAGMAKIEANFVELYGNLLEVLRVNRTFYVAPTGNDANDGLTPGTAVATILRACQLIHNRLWIARGVEAVVQLADGTYNESFDVPATHGPGLLVIQGNPTTPADVIVQSTGHTIRASAPVRVRLQAFRVRTSTANRSCVLCQSGGYLEVGPGMDFGTGNNSSWHITAANRGLVVCRGAYSISGQCEHHFYTEFGGMILADGCAVTITDNPDFGIFATARVASVIRCQGSSFTGSYTSSSERARAETNSCIDTGGGGSTYFPGNTPPSTADGGVYV